jgi:hypothetical protein
MGTERGVTAALRISSAPMGAERGVTATLRISSPPLGAERPGEVGARKSQTFEPLGITCGCELWARAAKERRGPAKRRWPLPGIRVQFPRHVLPPITRTILAVRFWPAPADERSVNLLCLPFWPVLRCSEHAAPGAPIAIIATPITMRRYSCRVTSPLVARLRRSARRAITRSAAGLRTVRAVHRQMAAVSAA